MVATWELEAGVSPQPLAAELLLGCAALLPLGLGVATFTGAADCVAEGFAAGAAADELAGCAAACSAPGVVAASSAAGVSVFSATGAGLSILMHETANSANKSKVESKRVRCKFIMMKSFQINSRRRPAASRGIRQFRLQVARQSHVSMESATCETGIPAGA